jgi:hypothetical protein
MNDDPNWRLSGILTGAVAGLLLAFGTTAHADADNGEFMGYRLGEEFVAPENAEPRPHVAGPRVYDFVVESRDHGAESMSIYASPRSSIIGSIFGEWYFSSRVAAKRFAERYLQSLTRRYDHWATKGSYLTHDSYQLSVEVQKKSRNDDFWPSPGKYRVAASLIYAPESLARGEWMAIVYMETSNPALTARQ